MRVLRSGCEWAFQFNCPSTGSQPSSHGKAVAPENSYRKMNYRRIEERKMGGKKIFSRKGAKLAKERRIVFLFAP
jgi:hypothetical protein